MTKKGFRSPSDDAPLSLMKPARPKVDESSEVVAEASDQVSSTSSSEAESTRSRLVDLVRDVDADTQKIEKARLNVEISKWIVNKINHLSIELGRPKKDIVDEMLADSLEYIEAQRGEEIADRSVRLPRGPRTS